jgi:ATP-binding cassette subfamily B protein
MISQVRRFVSELRQAFTLNDIYKAVTLLKPYILKHRKAYFGLLFFLLIEIFLTLVFAWFMGSITDAAVQSNFDRLKWLIPLGVLFTLISITSTFFSTLFETAAASTVKRDIKIDLFKHILLLPASSTSKRHSGELLSHFTNDVDHISGLIGSSLINFIRIPLLSIAAFIYLIHISWELSLISIFVAPLAILAGAFFGLLIRRNSRKIHKLHSDMNSHLNESFQGLSVIRSFTMEKLFHRKFVKQHQEFYSLELENTKLRGWFYSGSQAVNSIAFLISLCLGAYYVSIQKISVGSLLTFINLIRHLIYPLSGLAGLWAGFQHSITAIERLSNVLNHQTDSTDLSSYSTPKSIQHSIQFKNVTFGYERDTKVFDDLNLEIPAGKVIALIGHSGAGKTTLFNLLMRFYNPQEGSILIDGRSTESLSLSELRSTIAYVPQESFLFDGTIKDNLLLARPTISEAEMIEATNHANIRDFIMSLPNGYETEIGERGMKLSGGQKQRISIARALLKDAPLLLLDEATSALDNETEYHVKIALDQLMKNRTTIVIAHRLSTIQNADVIIVMNEGKIVQTGRHEELISQEGLYRHLNQSQFQPKAKLSLVSN